MCFLPFSKDRKSAPRGGELTPKRLDCEELLRKIVYQYENELLCKFIKIKGLKILEDLSYLKKVYLEDYRFFRRFRFYVYPLRIRYLIVLVIARFYCAVYLINIPVYVVFS